MYKQIVRKAGPNIWFYLEYKVYFWSEEDYDFLWFSAHLLSFGFYEHDSYESLPTACVQECDHLQGQ